MHPEESLNSTVTAESIQAQLIEVQTQGSSAKIVALEITGACGGHCPHCYAEPIRHHPQMPLNTAKTCLEGILRAGYEEVYIVGGEPMLHPDVLDICRHAQKTGLEPILVTTGHSLADSALADQILQAVSQIEVSIRSADFRVHDNIVLGNGWINDPVQKSPKVGSFHQAIKALDTLNRLKQIHQSMTAIAINHDLYQAGYPNPTSSPDEGQILQIARFLKKQQIQLDGFYAQLISPHGRAANNPQFPIHQLQVTAPQLIKALEELHRLPTEFGIEDVSLTDDPVKLGILDSLDQLPSHLRYLVASEVAPAIYPNGTVRPNVVVT